MDAITMLTERRSVRRFKEKKVPREKITEILEVASFAPSWANFQIARYTIIDKKETLLKLADLACQNFKPNHAIISHAAGVVVLSVSKNKSGHDFSGETASSTGDSWSMFDAGIASQTFSLAAYAKGVASVMIGFFDIEGVAELIDLPETEDLVVLIAYGYEKEHPKQTPRKPVSEISRFL